MSYQITRSHEVGKADHGWLRAKHYFSFANYYNPSKMGFGALRVINDDVVEPNRGFGTHPHRDMEIITIPQAGAVSHEDSGGNKGTIRKGEVQVMSAGRGVLHSEYNHSSDETLSLFQIWIVPNQAGVEPRYDQKKFEYQNTRNEWVQLVSPLAEKEEAGLKIHQDAYINAILLEANKTEIYHFKNSNNGLYLLVVEGEVEIAGEKLKSRDSIAIENLSSVTIRAFAESEVIAIEVPL